MNFAGLHPYVYYATRYPFNKGMSSTARICYTSSIYLIAEGKGTLLTNRRTYEAGSGSLYHIPAGQPHEWIADAQDPMVHDCCYFDWTPSIRDQTPNLATRLLCYDFAQLQQDRLGPIFPYPIPEQAKVENVHVWSEMFETFYTPNEHVNENTFMRSLKIQGHFQRFIEHFLTFALNKAFLPDPRINKVLQQIEQDIVHGILKPLENYYAKLRISRGYFFELFKQATGLTPLQYINRLRITGAKDDLRFSNLSVTEVAEKHHFSSVHYFSKLFRQVAGTTPREFRQWERSE